MSRERQARWERANREKVRVQGAAASRRWRERNPGKYQGVKRLELRRSPHHGLTREEVAARLAAQGGACAICRKPGLKGQDACGDHDHETGYFRAVLCAKCNVGIGMLHDDAARCRSAADYLDRHGQLQTLL